ncbi:PAS domain-containing protein [Clostridium tagluense]|uniref:PAS domain-containing protein n=1 Tax=Clostridium tagluense TaxID=360422 RepID=UPI001C0E0224|nr:PAS domain-containing protein [Clostridium tagluense]MBU3127583.1 PAS domain-containing protein [Clostridium tagluense]MBW9157950.1 PAS domain-containing protein [Clostridium tagluense]MCB2312599.1 PAS domain-containing protein [Clostridium tagluense]MCB2317275.1 PAS domain-containing protein [Clostridium tagluense]MCB2322142.1 PAS domain-containing protein [Clostridium tagluense]
MNKIVTNFQEADIMLKMQILDQLPTSVFAVDNKLNVIYVNNAAQKILNGTSENILGKACYNLFNSLHCNTEECRMRKAIDSGKICSGRNEVNANGLKIHMEYFCVPLKDENNVVIGGLEFAVNITERVQYEAQLKNQSKTIREMSTPTIKLWDDVLLLPIVGVVDSMRAQHMMDSMLNKIMETYSKVIIMDIQGVAAVDTAVANHLIKITKATKLMGCECIVSGISPAVAQTIIQLGIEMGDIKTKSTLSDALAEAFLILNLEVKNNS